MSLALALVTLSSCSSDEATPPSGGPSGSLCPTPSSLDYESFGRGFMEDYCTRCHSAALTGGSRNGAPSDHDFDTLEGIQAIPPEHIDGQAAGGPAHVNTAMPPSEPRPSQAEREKLGEWLACEAP